MLAACLGDKGPAPCRAGPPGLTGSWSWAQTPAGRLALGGASPGRVCPGQGPCGPSLPVPWRLRLAPRSLLSHLTDPAKPLPLPTCSQVELMPAGCPGSCLLVSAVTFPGALCHVSCPFSWGGSAPWDRRAAGAPQALSHPPGACCWGRSGILLQTPTKSGPAGPPCRNTSCVRPGLRNKLCVFRNRRACQGNECVWQAVGSAACLRGQTWVGGQAGPPAGPSASSPPVRAALPALGHPAPERLSNLPKVTQRDCRAVVSAPAPVVAQGPRPVPRA